MNFTADTLEKVFTPLTRANRAYRKHYPGDTGERQPVHTVYGGAQLFKAETAIKMGELSLRSLRAFAPDASSLARALIGDHDRELWETIYARVADKLQNEAVEDFRIDFEDGYGNRPDAEEDETAVFAAKETARGMKEKTLPPFIGIRIKPFNDELKLRGARTLDIYVSTLLQESGGKLPENFVVTLPKVSLPEQVSAFAELLRILEKNHGLSERSLRCEVMIETTQALLGADGRSNLPQLIEAGDGRCRGAHFGTYDFTAGSDITAAYQKMDHPACDFALLMMKAAFAGTGIWLSDGATSVMPVPPHKNPKTDQEKQENLQTVHRAWKLSFDHILHSLRQGYYQGWDLHPGQLVVRYAACYYFFLESLEQASVRLKNFVGKAAQATLVGDIFDDAATGQGLLNYFLRALNSGAIAEKEVLATGLTVDEVRGKSFLAIVKGRTK